MIRFRSFLLLLEAIVDFYCKNHKKMVKYISRKEELYRHEIIVSITSCFVLLSFLQKGEVKIRIINCIGCIIFVVYGILIDALSVWLLNNITLIVQIINIIKLSKKK